MKTFQPSAILDEVKNLVSISCNGEAGAGSSFSSLHKGIIKVYFEAKNVEIDYDKQIIKAEIPLSDSDYTTVSFECQELERFLKSCLKKDKKSLMFYQNVLTYYSVLEVA